jgi:hypothetical protein
MAMNMLTYVQFINYVYDQVGHQVKETWKEHFLKKAQSKNIVNL